MINMELNPITYTKARAFLDAQRICNEFCSLNRIDPPKYKDATLNHCTRPELAVFQHTGLYYDGTVIVNIPVVASPRWNPSPRSQSWPCWKTDRTMHGVVAHEVGHHVYERLKQSAKIRGWTTAKEWWENLRAFSKPPRVSSYEPVPTEAFAESMRLFILNPDLLKIINPMRHAMLLSYYRLDFSETRQADEVLYDAPDMILEKLYELEDK